MRTFLQEVKRILNWRVTLLFLPVAVIIYFLFIEFEYTVFPNGSEIYTYEAAEELVQRYGIKVTDANMNEFAANHERKIAEADTMIANHPKGQELGVSTYEELFTSRDEETKELDDFRWALMEEKDGLTWRIQAEQNLLEQYANKHIYPEYSKQQNERLQEIIQNSETQSVLPYMVVENVNRLAYNLSFLIMFALVMYLAPVFFRDRQRNVISIQYTSKKGRKLFTTKWLASVVVAFLLTTAILAAAFSAYVFVNDTTLFWEATVNSFATYNYFWFNFTFNQYMVVIAVIFYMLSFALATAIVLVSRLSTSYFTLLGILVPAIILLFNVTGRYSSGFFTIWQYKYELFLLLGLSLALSFSCILWRARREQKIDLL
ncbi:ABC transporter permease [Bacillus sp. JCM 19041]|uniref:ABC transporter permease n=1 Tax=Bacillus sp. JCM 19041 TaxID=1460637 RepID=UPI0006D2C512